MLKCSMILLKLWFVVYRMYKLWRFFLSFIRFFGIFRTIRMHSYCMQKACIINIRIKKETKICVHLTAGKWLNTIRTLWCTSAMDQLLNRSITSQWNLRNWVNRSACGQERGIEKKEKKQNLHLLHSWIDKTCEINFGSYAVSQKK